MATRSSPKPTKSRIRRFALALTLLGLHATVAHGSETAATTPVTAVTEVCEFRTINYITHTLPQQCLRTAWSSPTQTAAADITITISSAPTATPTVSEAESGTQQQQQQQQHAVEQENGENSQEEPVASSFMSFEEWKEMMLRKSGQDPANIKAHKPREHKVERDTGGNIGEPDSVGEEGEISLDFDALTEKVSEMASSSSSGGSAQKTEKEEQEAEEQVFYDDGKTQYYRSKDAGTTCKERHSFASFDAGATIKKTSKGAKNAKAILAENKDSYMLLECQAKDKFVDIELSDDILVDTIVLANFEFFSSMIRKFRVMASDRYPVKPDKWVDLGTFEARNARDIQAFLVEHPQIYTKYIRVEFLTHYGNEYYCPVSLLRVHGTRMLDTWKEPREDDEPELIEGSSQEEIAVTAPKVQQPLSTPEDAASNTTKDMAPEQSQQMGLSPWQPSFNLEACRETCAARSPTTDEPSPVYSQVNSKSSRPAGHTTVSTAQPPSVAGAQKTPKSNRPSSPVPVQPESPTTQGQSTVTPSPPAPSTAVQPNNNKAPENQSQKPPAAADSSSSAASVKPTGPPGTKSNKTNTASGSPPLPTVQESFFKTVTKRLNHLESNTSLSLQYIEEQSKFLQDVLLKLERKQLSRVDSFLDTLNKTVLSELRNVRTQYDQIWQSTVIALETQREQSNREIVALTTRLNVLAEEVVFQKRMAIFQSVLLLSCLVLVIFNSSNSAANNSSSSFAIPPGSAAAAYYRRYASGFGGSGARSDLSASPLHPTPGGGHKSPVGFGSPSPPSRQQHSSSFLAASALPRRLFSSSSLLRSQAQVDKSLPLTPEYSRENTPASPPPPSDILSSPVLSYDQEGQEDVGIEGTPLRRRRWHRRHNRRASTASTVTADEGDGEDDDNEDDQTPDSSTSETNEQHRQQTQSQAAAAPPLQPPPIVRQRSTHSQLSGGIRKPLPALPEDPS
ncbi:UNC-like C-terminal-domain-containing protein [Cladorrhinum samala]|uniref:UNC-like C-terminal-domain-containing protein n=1 Tax=Cladorrhinum samala TaxID=585594 RepID=A0AAV9HNP1_9PEZI|nr:UNC-like C-terminal-domain-containing protein [Cladorrhinum samala]